MKSLLQEKLDSDLKLLSYHCDELLNSKIRLKEYSLFCKNYYYFLRVLSSINQKNKNINLPIERFPPLEYPSYSFGILLVFISFFSNRNNQLQLVIYAFLYSDPHELFILFEKLQHSQQ